MDHFGHDVHARVAQVQGAQEAAVDRAHHAGHRADVLARGAGEEPVGDPAESEAEPRHVDDPPTAHVGRGENEARVRPHDTVEQQCDVLRSVAQVDVEDNDVLAAALREARLERLAEAEVARVVEDADSVELLGKLRRDRARLVAAAIVDDDHFETEPPDQRHQVIEQDQDVITEDRRFVVSRQDE